MFSKINVQHCLVLLKIYWHHNWVSMSRQHGVGLFSFIHMTFHLGFPEKGIFSATIIYRNHANKGRRHHSKIMV